MNAFNKYSIWKNVSLSEWTDWRWQYTHCIENISELKKVINLTNNEINEIAKANSLYRMKISPHICLRIAENLNTQVSLSLKKQFIPTKHEIVKDKRLFDDVNEDKKYMPVKGLVHRYPTKVLIFPSYDCGTFCRYCFRKKFVGNRETQLSYDEFMPIFSYLKKHSDINEVIFSGGDPLTSSDEMLDYILKHLSDLNNIKIVRIHTRMPITIPYRVDEHFIKTLTKYKERFAIYCIVHIDSVNELSDEAINAISTLIDKGVICLASCPLLKGINDSEIELGKLWSTLIEKRVKPYYLFHTDPVQGIRHFVVSIERGMEIMKNMYDRISGLAIPLYCFNVPGGGGHILLSPQNIKKVEENKFLIENFEGHVYEYIEPIGK